MTPFAAGFFAGILAAAFAFWVSFAEDDTAPEPVKEDEE